MQTQQQHAEMLKAERDAINRRAMTDAELRDLVLRQWCVDKAIAAIAASPNEQHDSPHLVAEKLYKFIKEGGQ